MMTKHLLKIQKILTPIRGTLSRLSSDIIGEILALIRAAPSGLPIAGVFYRLVA